MSGRTDWSKYVPALPRRSHGPHDGRGPNLQKIIGMALTAIGALYTCYNAAQGFSWLVKLVFDHFGLVLLASTINFIFFTIVLPPHPFGGLIANGFVGTLAIGAATGLPAIPGLILTGAGAFVYFTA